MICAMGLPPLPYGDYSTGLWSFALKACVIEVRLLITMVPSGLRTHESMDSMEVLGYMA